jgi:hypothetical protein
MTTYSLVTGYQLFGDIYFFYFQVDIKIGWGGIILPRNCHCLLSGYQISE